MFKMHADIAALLLIIVGFLLNLFAPIWLKPPLFEYTIWLYLLVFLAWVPIYIIYSPTPAAQPVYRGVYFVRHVPDDLHLHGLCAALCLCHDLS